ncbi:uncharacterized protein LOC118560795 [Fundulus heteroclitus]|uniref:uncharacterized protein LOC118560795 n=1 Tax=Fundulus heteroclitus TaxID=8078 RepID=UPI00165BC0B8|nr:uncharacterized protein LOC118560795 [Fundulus heteroclitus]
MSDEESQNEATGLEEQDYKSELSFKALSATRRGKLGQCTRKMNEIKAIMCENVDVEDVKKEVAAFHTILNDFKFCHESTQALLSDDVKESENLDWYEPRMARYNEFLANVDEWLKQHNIDPQTLVDVTDSVSRVSKTASKTSKISSTVSSIRIQLAVDKAGLLAKAKVLEEKHEIELEKVKLQARMETLQLQEDLAISHSKLKVLEELEPSQEIKPQCETEDDMNAYLEGYLQRHKTKTVEVKSSESSKIDSILSPPHFAELGAVPKTPLQKTLREHQVSELPPVAAAAAPAKQKMKPNSSKVTVTDVQTRKESTPGRDRSEHSDISIQRQSDLTNLLVSVVSQTSLPKKEVPVFSGDPLEFQLFMQAFRHNIEDKTDSNEDRLYFLEQFTAGQPKELVRSCLHLDATAGFIEAKRLLKHHFGNEFKIASAYMNKALTWATIRPDDAKALHSYGLYLRSCNNAAQSFQYMSELDLPSNMKLIVSKLPYKLRERWRSVVCDIMEQTQQRPKFCDLVKFIEKQVKILQDPVFGDIQDVTKISQPRRVVADLPHVKSGAKKSFATTVSPVVCVADANRIYPVKMENGIKGPTADVNDAFLKPCTYCKGNHALETCQKITKLLHQQKVDFLKKNGFCFACLIKGHLSKSCKNRLICRSCGKKHPTILHIANSPPDGAVGNVTVSSVAKKDASSGTDSIILGMASTVRTGAGTIDHKLPIVPVKRRSWRNCP